MKRLSPTLFVTAVASVLFTAANARADFITWSYNWDRSPDIISADVAGTGGIVVTNGSTLTAMGSSMTVASNLKTFSSAPINTPATFTAVPYNLTITLTDAASLATDTLSFGGTVNGTLSSSHSNITNTFSGPTTQTSVLGGNTYTVTIGPFSPPGPPSSTTVGSISAFVSVLGPQGGGGGGGGGSVGGAPEPSTAVLSCLGISFLGLSSWRRRKTSQAA